MASPLSLYADRCFRRVPLLPFRISARELPALSIIVPARNEARNLRKLLPTLLTTSYPGSWEVIVVDDNSTDGTHRIAQEAGARVISLQGLPTGWSGKAYACHRGACAATGEWLLFTDADTVHHPRGPASAVGYAERHGLAGLSIFLPHVTSGLIDGMALAVAFSGLFLGRGAGSPTLNGQYILLRRDVYVASGGFSAVAGESVEDLALGRHLRRQGFRVPLFRSDDVAAVHMYTSTTSLWQGLVRLGAGTLRWLGARSLITALFVTSVMTPILLLVATFRQGRARKWALASWAVAALGFVPWARRFGSLWLAALAPIGALAVQLAGVVGFLRRLSGRGVVWKGRRV